MINTFVQVTSKFWNTVVSFVNKDPLFHWMSGNPLSFFFHSRFPQTQVTLVILGWQLKRFCTNQQSLETEEKLISFYDSPPLRPTTSGKTSQRTKSYLFITTNTQTKTHFNNIIYWCRVTVLYKQPGTVAIDKEGRVWKSYGKKQSMNKMTHHKKRSNVKMFVHSYVLLQILTNDDNGSCPIFVPTSPSLWHYLDNRPSKYTIKLQRMSKNNSGGKIDFASLRITKYKIKKAWQKDQILFDSLFKTSRHRTLVYHNNEQSDKKSISIKWPSYSTL